jgi:hypothetical protein
MSTFIFWAVVAWVVPPAVCGMVIAAAHRNRHDVGIGWAAFRDLLGWPALVLIYTVNRLFD